MEISPYGLLLLLIYSFVFGLTAGVVNDINRITRVFCGVKYSEGRFDKLYKIKMPLIGCIGSEYGNKKITKYFLNVLIFFQDIILFAYLGCGVVVLNFYLNKGEIRLYTVFAVAVGFALYYFTLGKLVMLFSEVVAFSIRIVIKMTLTVLLLPFKFVLKKCRNICLKCSEKFSNLLEKKRIIRYNKKRQGQLIALSQKGFVPEYSPRKDKENGV